LVNLNLLPKRLRRRAGPDWWRTAAIAVPLLVLGTVAYLTVQTSMTLNAKIQRREELRAEVAILQPYVEEYQKLQRRKRELEEIASVAREVKQTFKPWSEYLAEFLNRLPKQKGRLVVSLTSINAHPIGADQGEQRYGIPAEVEFSVRGEAESDRALVQFVKVYETDPKFGINFQNANLDQRTGIYTFNANIGMLVEPPKTMEEEQNAGGAQ